MSIDPRFIQDCNKASDCGMYDDVVAYKFWQLGLARGQLEASIKTYVNNSGDDSLHEKIRKTEPIDTSHYMQPYAIPLNAPLSIFEQFIKEGYTLRIIGNIEICHNQEATVYLMPDLINWTRSEKESVILNTMEEGNTFIKDAKENASKYGVLKVRFDIVI